MTPHANQPQGRQLNREKTSSFYFFCLLAALAISLNGCAAIAKRSMLESLDTSLARQTDLQLLREGAPALLLMLDGLIASEPGNQNLLIAGTKAYSAYAGALAEKGETDRALAMSVKGRDYGLALLNLYPEFRKNNGKTTEDFSRALDAFGKQDVPALFWGGYGWANWIKFQNGAPAAMADLPMVELLMQRVISLDESFYYGAAHIFMGSYYGSRPKMFGGRPGDSRQHFEKALTLSGRRFLLTQVAYAETYAKTIFNEKLYRELLQEVIDAPLPKDELASSNQLAKVTARKLLDLADEYF